MRLEHEARGFSFLSRQPVRSMLAGRRAGRLRGRGLSFEEIREYRPGDDIRAIDWRASARTGHTQTRVYAEERDRPTLLVVDLTAAMFFGSTHATKSAVAAEAAALAAWRGLRAGDRLGALIFSDEGFDELRSHRSRRGVERILGVLARRAAALAETPPRPAGPAALNAALRRAERIVGHDWLVVVIADMQAADAEGATLMGRIGRHNDMVAIPVSDPLERAPPPPSWRGGLATDGTRTRAVGAGGGVAEEHARRLAAIRQRGLRLATPVLPLGTEEDAVPQLRRMLGRSGPAQPPAP